MGDTVDSLSQLFLPLVGAAGGGLAAYVAIRADLAALNAKFAYLDEMSKRAHDRIDSILKSGG